MNMNPQREMIYRVPSSTSTYCIKCSFCDRESYATPNSIEDEKEKWDSHQCTRYCNGFSCKKYLVKSNYHEFYVADEKYFVCSSCYNKCKDHYSLRPFWKLPVGSRIFNKPGQWMMIRTDQSYRKESPYNFEDLWYLWYTKLDSFGKDFHKKDYIKWENYIKCKQHN
jgi:hypothetical protein